jgi:hypothetical protein
MLRSRQMEPPADWSVEWTDGAFLTNWLGSNRPVRVTSNTPNRWLIIYITVSWTIFFVCWRRCWSSRWRVGCFDDMVLDVRALWDSKSGISRPLSKTRQVWIWVTPHWQTHSSWIWVCVVYWQDSEAESGGQLVCCRTRNLNLGIWVYVEKHWRSIRNWMLSEGRSGFPERPSFRYDCFQI